MPERFPYFLAFRNIGIKDVAALKMEFRQPTDIMKLALRFSDATVITDDEVDPVLLDYAKEIGIPTIKFESNSSRQDKTNLLNTMLQDL